MSEEKKSNEESGSKITPDIFTPTVTTSSETRGGVITARVTDGSIKQKK